ncbi:MAG: hypothetical protein JW908_12865 [Anaerolineales bacterium]|nr:hypothetical protein [Anaerolineales bacterium]
MKIPSRMNKGCRIIFCNLIILSMLILKSAQAAPFFINIPGPANSFEFGTTITVLPNGNIVVTDPNYPSYSENTFSAYGAVYLYNPNGVLISTLTGDYLTNSVGSGGITVLVNGNYVVSSPYWESGDNPSKDALGAVTWCSQVTGCNGTVSSANSLIGSSEGDNIGGGIGGGITALANGNYVVHSPNWNNGSVVDAGAVTWGNGSGGTVGVVSASNSLVGSSNFDKVGNNYEAGIFTLTNGNYLVLSPAWNNGSIIDAGAITWGNGVGSTAGPVSPSNSLVGSTNDDWLGNTYYGSIIELTNGNYVALNSKWDLDSTHPDVGAVTWGSGTMGVSGVVSPSNSLVGASSSAPVGDIYKDNDGVTALANGNYVVSSPYWTANGSSSHFGAVTWGNGTTGVSGSISASNSLLGSHAGDYVGYEVISLNNGNYVVSSPDWYLDEDNLYAGAVTWGDGTTGISGAVSSSNSLVSNGLQSAGNGGVIALTNGNYVVSTPTWGNEALHLNNVGAVTWGDGSIGITGMISTTNSLVGDFTYASVGNGGLVALANGNYVVISSSWDNGSANNAGAVTWGNGTVGTIGTVSTTNSLVGSTTDDALGGVIALTNGNYVVFSPDWDNGSIVDAGATTWGNGVSGTVGEVSAINSLVGSADDDQVGNAVTALSNGNYVVGIPQWDHGVFSDVGAVTWGNGEGGTTGPVSASNSLIGSATNDLVGNGSTFSPAGVTKLINGNYLVNSPNWNNGIYIGAFTWGNGTGGTTGVLSISNSLVNSCLNDSNCSSSISPYSDGNASLFLPDWNDGSNDGAISLLACDSDITVGVVSTSNSVLGNHATGGNSMVADYDASRTQLIVGRPKDNIVTIFRCQVNYSDWIFLPTIIK